MEQGYENKGVWNKGMKTGVWNKGVKNKGYGTRARPARLLLQALATLPQELVLELQIEGGPDDEEEVLHLVALRDEHVEGRLADVGVGHDVQAEGARPVVGVLHTRGVPFHARALPIFKTVSLSQSLCL